MLAAQSPTGPWSASTTTHKCAWTPMCSSPRLWCHLPAMTVPWAPAVCPISPTLDSDVNLQETGFFQGSIGVTCSLGVQDALLILISHARAFQLKECLAPFPPRILLVSGASGLGVVHKSYGFTSFSAARALALQGCSRCAPADFLRVRRPKVLQA